MVSWLLNRFGIINSLMINAALALVAILTFILHPGLAFIAFANIARYTFSETLDIPARELLYFPLSGRLRERAQTFANGMLAPMAQGAAGVALLVIVPFFDSPIGLAFIALLFAAIWLFAAFRGEVIRTIKALADRRCLMALSGAAFLGPTIGVWLSLVAVKHTQAGIAMTLMSTFPVVVIPLAMIVHKERPSYRSVLGAIIAVIGVAMLFIE